MNHLNPTVYGQTGNETLCISVSARPSRFGMTVHNAGYRALGLDYLYKAFQVRDIESAIRGVRALGIRGCSVSMPFKTSVIPFLDSLDPLAESVGAVNTIVNHDGELKGYNTDVIGAAEALKTIQIQASDTIVLLGAGGVARAIIQSLIGFNVLNTTVCARRPESIVELQKQFDVESVNWSERENQSGSILINATPIGMAPDIDTMPVSKDCLSKFRAVMDVVAMPPTSLFIDTARQANVDTVDGLTMTLHQACAQFELYTGCKPPFDVMKDAALTLYN